MLIAKAMCIFLGVSFSGRKGEGGENVEVMLSEKCNEQ